MLVLVSRHRPTPDIPGFGQRAAHIQLAAVVVPGADARAGVALELCGGLFAHKVDGRTQGAGASEQAGGALEHFDPVIDRHVAQGVTRRVGHVARSGRNAVVLEVVDGETTGVVVAALGIEGRDGDARRVAHHVVNVVQAEVVHVLAGDDGHRLRRLLGRQHQACRGGDVAWGIGTGVFGHVAQLVGGDLGRAQL